MTDTEALAGYLSRYLARRAETPRDPMDWAGQRLYALAANRLRGDPALQELADEASAGEGAVSPATLRRTALALVAATEHDPNFARALALHLQTCEAAETAMGPVRSEDDDTAVGEPGFLAGYVPYLIPGNARRRPGNRGGAGRGGRFVRRPPQRRPPGFRSLEPHHDRRHRPRRPSPPRVPARNARPVARLK